MNHPGPNYTYDVKGLKPGIDDRLVVLPKEEMKWVT